MKRFNIDIKLNKKQELIAINRYLKLDQRNNPIENIKDTFIRISKLVASVENKYQINKNEIKRLEDEFFEIQAKFEFLSGFTLSDRGRNKLTAACYVLPLHDSLESIYKTLYQSVQLHRLGAGIGYDFSEIRPEGSKVNSTGKEASGPISFMRLYDFSSEIILNRGSARHAGHMGILRIDHPDIENFVNSKHDYNQLTNFNISVALTDKFMGAYKNNRKFSLINPSNKKVFKNINARKLMRILAESVYKSGEPGVVFIDEINRKNTLPKLGTITATNLCGEQPLLPYEACNLGSIDINKFIINKNSKDISQRIDWNRLEKVTRLGVKYLDNTIDISYFILREIKNIVYRDNRKIGLGIRGWADLLASLSIPYDSEKAIKLAEKIMKFIKDISRDESSQLGRIKGSFANFKESIFPSLGYKFMRNATITTIAPTGTISLFSNCNGGIEPFFALYYIRDNMETLGNKKLIYINKILEEKLKKEWLYSKELMQKISKTGSLKEIKEIPDKLKKVLKTAYEISPYWHLKMQAAFQKYTDNAVSKTINIPKNTSIKDIENIYLSAYKLKLKGVSIYRDKSRDKQVLNINQ